MAYQGYLADAGYAEPPARACDDRRLPTVGPVTPFTTNRLRCPPIVFGVADPGGAVRAAVARAVAMLDNTIGELVHARSRVCQGAPPGWPLLGDITLQWLRDRLGVCVDDIRVWTAGTFVNRSVAEIIRRLVRVRTLIASNHIRYVCGGRCDPADQTSGCVQGDWAFVCIPDPCPRGSVPSVVHLCREFWVPGVNDDGTRVAQAVHAEFQAQTIIHEASHLYHCTSDLRGSSIGVAECLAQFVAATNGSPIDSSFSARCRVTTRCAPAVAAAPGPGSGGLGLAAAGAVRIVRTAFRPQRAIRPRGRPAARR